MTPPEDDPRILDETVGKTIAGASIDTPDCNEQITLAFTDGTTLVLTSWDYEGYSSGITISRSAK